MSDKKNRAFLDGVRVLELADELGEYCGKVLAGLAADVIKIEQPKGRCTRGYGPFYHDEPHRDRRLCFWHYNPGKRAVVLDLDTHGGADRFKHLALSADVIIDTRAAPFLSDHALGYETLRALKPGLVYSRIRPFGDEGPWAGYEASDLSISRWAA